MQIQLSADRNIEGHEALVSHVSNVVQDALSQFSDHITRVEIHLSDEDGVTKDCNSGQGDQRCMMEARLERFHPVAVTAYAASVQQAVDAAADKLARMVDSTLGRLHDHKHRRDALTLDDERPPEA